MRFFVLFLCVFFVSCVLDEGIKVEEMGDNEGFVFPEHFAEALSLRDSMHREGFVLGAKVFIRIFKKERVLELWMLKSDGRFHLYRRFPICAFSGDLGPKLREGDLQSPEGVYRVSREQMNPNSRYHLSFNLGFPNAYDRAHGYTGSYLMVHGDCVSRGCYAMDDRQIEIIYAIVSEAHQRGQRAVDVHVFPFHLTEENLEAYRDHRWFDFWQMLAPIYRSFEEARLPPVVEVKNKRYVLSEV